MEIINAYGSWLVLITAVFGFFYGIWYWCQRRIKLMGTSVGREPLQQNKRLLLLDF